MTSHEFIDGEALRRVMRLVPSPVTVVTAVGPGGVRGATIGSFNSVSLDPPLISFNVAVESRMHETVETADRMAIHLLGVGHAPVSVHFSLPADDGAEQFKAFPHRLKDGVPVLAGVLAVLHCLPYAMHAAGDHSIVVARVVDIERLEDGAPLIYQDRGYHALSDLPPDAVNVGSKLSPDAGTPKKAKS